jgi:hypothetical protein
MRAALKASQELENEEPDDHYHNCGTAYNPEHSPFIGGAEYAPIEEDCTELHTAKSVGGENV